MTNEQIPLLNPMLHSKMLDYATVMLTVDPSKPIGYVLRELTLRFEMPIQNETVSAVLSLSDSLTLVEV